MRFTSRCLLGSYFIADGLKAAINPTPLVEQAQPLADKLTRSAQRYLPDDAARRMPVRTETLIRIHGIVQATGALMMATGIFRRAGAAAMAIAYAPKVLMARPGLADDKLPFVRDLALLGAALIAAGDTQGKPNLSWLAAEKKRSVKATKKAAKAELAK